MPDYTGCLRRKYEEDKRRYTSNKEELKELIDNYTEYTAWADSLAANKNLILLQRRCEVHKELIDDIAKLGNYSSEYI